MSDDKNCFNLPHKQSSIAICAIGMLVLLVMLILTPIKPHIINIIYSLGLTDEQALISGCVFFAVLLVIGIFLAVGLYLESPCPMMVWLVGNIIIWNIHLIIVLAVGVLTATRKTTIESEKEKAGIIVARILCLLLLKVAWMTVICLVGRHWYVLCEEIMAEEYPERRLPSMRQRFRTWSTWSRAGTSNRAPSGVSTRMPVLMDRIQGK